MTVTDPRPALEIGLALLPTIFQYGNFSAMVDLDVTKIPHPQALNESLFPNTTLLFDDGDALRWENYYSIDEWGDFVAPLYLGAFMSSFAPFRFPFLESPRRP